MGKVLVGCEESQAVCIAFRELGHEAYSCDLQDCSGGHPEWHLKMDVFEAIEKLKPELLIAHPPCTRLTVTANKWYKPEYAERFPNIQQERKEAIEFFMKFTNADIPKICIENPVGIMSTIWRKPNQIIHPYYFGHIEAKKTCLWLKGLPRLNGNVEFLEANKEEIQGQYFTTKSGKRMAKWYGLIAAKHPDRAKLRSKTFPGIAKAMAVQWGRLL